MVISCFFVDDEPDMEELVRQRFRKQMREGLYDFEFAQNGRLALMKLEQHPDINMVVTDINMPEMDGLTLVGELESLTGRSEPSLYQLTATCKTSGRQ